MPNSKTYTIRLPQEWVDVIRSQAKKRRLTASEFIRESVFLRLPKAAQRKLPEIKLGRPEAEE